MRFDTLKRYVGHKPDQTTLENMRLIRWKCREMATLIEKLCPESREKATALTQLSFVMMSANSAMVQKCPVDTADLTEWELEEWEKEINPS